LAELAWSLRQNTSRGRRAQVAILIVTFALGLGPLVFGALLPRLLFLIESSLSLNLAMFSLLFIPVGVAYAVVRYQSSHFYRQTENLLVPGTIGLAVFIFLFLTLGYLAGDVQGNRLLGTVIPALVAAAGAAVASIGSATFGGDKGSLETVESRRRQALLPLYNRLVQARAIAPMLIGTRQEHTTQLRPTLDALIPKLHAALGLPDIPVGEERDVISSLKSLVDEVESLVSYPIIFDCTRSDRRAEVSPEVSHVLYAISQQALSNVVLHSRASEVTISLEFQQDHVLLHIRDNGVGFAATAWEKLPDYPGLQKAAQHVRRIGGELRLYASPGRGTWIIAKAPYNSSL
ncbi:MAG: hypothetical protein HY685_02720, partial [Chloroflexi bacterium]|nr:hypothetical protein [Chloroflexota bacterium]